LGSKGKVNHHSCKLLFEILFVGLQLRKRKKASVVPDQPRASKPLAVILSLATVAGSFAIMFNAFFNQDGAGAGKTALISGDARTHMSVSADDKTSRTITFKYDALVEDVQRELLATGHFNGLVDGVTGPKTKIAIEEYQRENKLAVTGEVSKTLLGHIQDTRKVNQAAEFTGTVSREDEPAPKPVDAAPLAIKPVKKTQALPVGDKALLKLQERLAALGYDPGSRSGQLDEGTRSAILIFEMDHGLPMQGKISKSLLEAVKAVEAKPRKKN
jgi:peptidoglycan hydrolase-like protein with peptidoglycan-binding domain